MSEQPVSKSDIIKGNPIDEFSEELDRGLKKLEEYDEGLKSIASTMSSDLKKAMGDTLKSIELINDAEKESKKVLDEKIATEKDIVTFQKSQIKVQQAQEKQTKKTAASTKRFRREIENMKDPLKRLNIQVRAARENARRLALMYGETDKRTIKARETFEKLDNKLKEVNNTTRNGRKTLTELINTNKKLKISFSSLTQVVGQFGVAIGGAALVRGTVSTLAEFDEKVADVAKTTGLTTKAARDLSKELLEIDTRSSITALQELASAGGRLGLTAKEDILGFATAADKVFVALGDDLGGTAEEIATDLGKISSLFGLQDEFGIEGGIERVGSGLNELSASSKASAGGIQNFTNRMGGLASVLELADVQALGALFDESGQSIEVAASTLTKLLPALASDFKRFAKVAGVAPEEFKKIAEESPIEALKLVAKGAQSSEKGLFALTEVIESFGIDSARATGIVGVLSDNVDRFTELQGLANNALDENTSIAAENATKQDTLSALWEKFTNRIKAYILGSEGATKISESLKNALGFLADNLETIVSVLWEAVKAFLSYKAALLALKAAKGITLLFNGLASSIKNTTASTKGAAQAFKNFKGSITTLGLTALIQGLAQVAAEYWNIRSGANAAALAQRLFNKGQQKGAESAIAFLEKERDLILKAKQAVDDKIKSGELEADQREKAFKDIEAESQKRINTEIARLSVLKAVEEGDRRRATEAAKRIRDETGFVGDLTSAWSEALGISESNFSKLSEYDIAAAKAGEAVGAFEAKIEALKNNVLEYNEAQVEAVESQNNSAAATGKSTEAQVKFNTELEATVEHLSEQLELLHELDQIAVDIEVRQIDEQIDELIANAAKLARETAELDVDPIEDLINKKTEVLKKAAEERRDFQIATLEEQTRIQNATEIQAAIDRRDKLLAQENLTPDARKKILDQYDEDLKQQERNQLQRAADLELKIRALKLKTSEELVDITKQGNDEINQANDELIDAQVEGAEKLNESAEESIETQKEFLNEWIRIQQAITDALEKQIDRRIALTKEEKDAAKSSKEFFKQLAKEGNIEAKESIKEQIQFEKEAQREIERLERRKANLKLISQGLTTFEKQLEDGKKPGEALAATIVSTEALTSYLSGLKFFAKGTDNAPAGMAVVDEQGAEIITDRKGNIKSLGTSSGPRLVNLKSGDKVYTAPETANIVRALDDVDNASTLADVPSVSGTMLGLNERSITRAFNAAVRNMPHSRTYWKQIHKGMGKIVSENVRGNDVERTNTIIG